MGVNPLQALTSFSSAGGNRVTEAPEVVSDLPKGMSPSLTKVEASDRPK